MRHKTHKNLSGALHSNKREGEGGNKKKQYVPHIIPGAEREAWKQPGTVKREGGAV